MRSRRSALHLGDRASSSTRGAILADRREARDPLFRASDIAVTVGERTTEIIRHRILTLAPGYQPAERLYPGRLAEELGVSITPIREALKLLAFEGLVQFSPRRGATVTRFSAADFDDLVGVRAGLESLAIRLNQSRLTEEELDRLSRCLDACERAIAEGDLARYQANDQRFHRSLVVSGRSPRLLALYDGLLRQAQIMNVQNPHYIDAVQESLREHRALVQEVAHGDVARSEQAIQHHWQRSRERLRRKYHEFVPAIGGEMDRPPASGPRPRVHPA